MGSFMFVLGPCIGCGRLITYNPVAVPSIRHPRTGKREPICERCFDRWNELHRVSKGLPPEPLLPGAYEPQEVD